MPPEPIRWHGRQAYRITRGYFRKGFVLAFALNEAITKVLAANQLTVVTSILVVALFYL